MYLSETKSHLTTAHEITWKLIHLLVGWILYLYCFPVFFFLGCLLVFHVLLCPLVFVFHFCAFGFSFSFFFFQISALPFNTFLFFFNKLLLVTEDFTLIVRRRTTNTCQRENMLVLQTSWHPPPVLDDTLWITYCNQDIYHPFISWSEDPFPVSAQIDSGGGNVMSQNL